MIEPHLYLCDSAESVPGRWMEAFPQGLALDMPTLERRLRSHVLDHGLVWLSAAGSPPWAERVARLLSLQAQLRIVLLSGVPTEEEGLRAIQSGIRGYAHSHAVPSLLQEVALVVHHGGLWLGPDLMRRLVKATADALVRSAASHSALAAGDAADAPSSRRIHQVHQARRASATTEAAPVPSRGTHGHAPVAGWLTLTLREQQIAHAVAKGRSNKEIAALMDIAEKTVKAHLGSVFQKLGVRDRLQLVVMMAEPQE